MFDKLVAGLGVAGLGDAISLLAAAFFASRTNGGPGGPTGAAPASDAVRLG
jgi:hypothetical protein